MISGHKAVLLPLIVVPGAFLVDRVKWATAGLAVGLVFLIGLSSWIAEAYDNLIPLSLLVRRGLLVPANLAFEYYDFFSRRLSVAWSNGLLDVISTYPYALPPPVLVASHAFGSAEAWANNGLFGSGYMQLRFAGIAFYSLVVGLALRLIDAAVAARVPRRLAVGVIATPFLALINSDPATVFVTHGLGMALLLLLLTVDGRGSSRRAT
jgi:hypothetical protein